MGLLVRVPLDRLLRGRWLNPRSGFLDILTRD
jgi:hypothetical protein